MSKRGDVKAEKLWVCKAAIAPGKFNSTQIWSYNCASEFAIDPEGSSFMSVKLLPKETALKKRKKGIPFSMRQGAFEFLSVTFKLFTLIVEAVVRRYYKQDLKLERGLPYMLTVIQVRQ